ncbi:hypothetical protein F2Q70_00004450 [Brassica cretica]|uniref:Uncharacterized protein n=1 Tax=Brassica cretica TaxID=69181 RepID=A0A8S9INB9_BRACR|nr:hypothetical protein F2Q70_00004450 [Brassica cretica]KAF3562897.1 hypothetical protein DY000_02016477 [Brassica cretica]
MIDNPGRFKDDAGTVIWLFPGSEQDMRGDRFSNFREFRSVCKICPNSYGTIYRDMKNRLRLSSLDYPPRFGLASSPFCLLIWPYSFRVCLAFSNSKNIDSSWTSMLSWPRLGCCQSSGFRDPCFNLSIIVFTKMNKHLVENFLAFRNSQGRSRDAKDDQEDSPGDEVLAVMRFWRQIKA